jgi:hypothetical protein
VLLLIAAFAAWANPLGRSQLRRLNGSAVANSGNLQMAALMLLTAVGLSAVAAVLAIAGWFAV